MLAIAPPSKSEPVSPINTFAGCKLNIKKPKHAPINIVPNIVISFTPNIIPITVRHVIIIVVTLVESPSIPSVKLTAFVVANITTTANGIYSHIGRLIDVLKNGMYVSVPKCNI